MNLSRYSPLHSSREILDPLHDLQSLLDKAHRQPPRAYDVSSARSTPEIFCEPAFDPVEVHKNSIRTYTALLWQLEPGVDQRQLIKDAWYWDTEEAHRQDIKDARYWEVQDVSFQARYWHIVRSLQSKILQPVDQSRRTATTRQTTEPACQPISARLRSKCSEAVKPVRVQKNLTISKSIRRTARHSHQQPSAAPSSRNRKTRLLSSTSQP